MSGRVGVFVDGTNVRYALESGGADILRSFGSIINEFSKNKGIMTVRSIYLECYELDKWEKTDAREHGFALKRCIKNERKNGDLKSNVDMTMACDMMYSLIKDEVDAFVIVSADSDFLPILHWITERGKSATIVVNRYHSPSYIRAIEDLGHEAVQIELLARRHKWPK